MGRARGTITGSLIAFALLFYGASGFAAGIRYLLLAAGLAVTITLLLGGIALQRRAAAMTGPTPEQRAAGRRIWRWFWLNLLGEIVLLNVAINLLAAPGLRIYWIPAISAVVGLHFLPMARFFRVRNYYAVGAAMIAGAAVAAILIARNPHAAPALIHGEAVVNAAILWIALGTGIRAARRR